MADEKKRPEKLDDEAIQKFKTILEKKKEQILKDLQDISGAEGGPKVKFPDFGDKIDENVQEIGEYTTNLATEKVLESTLRDIESSLARIKKGTYGICRYCKEPIGEKRMLARPVASACVKCKTKLQSQI